MTPNACLQFCSNYHSVAKQPFKSKWLSVTNVAHDFLQASKDAELR